MKLRQTKVAEFAPPTTKDTISTSPLQIIVDYARYLCLIGIPISHNQQTGEICPTKDFKHVLSIAFIAVLHYGLMFIWSSSLFMSKDNPMDVIKHYYAVGFSGVDLFAANASNLPNLAGIVCLFVSLKGACAGLSAMHKGFCELDRRLAHDRGML